MEEHAFRGAYGRLAGPAGALIGAVRKAPGRQRDGNAEAGPPQRVWNTGAGWYTGVGIPASRAFNCKDRNCE